jgi:hypothetical protein
MPAGSGGGDHSDPGADEQFLQALEDAAGSGDLLAVRHLLDHQDGDLRAKLNWVCRRPMPLKYFGAPSV